MKIEKVDVCIMGGGMIGASLAVGLSNIGCKVAVIERKRPDDFDAKQAPDIRMSALNQFSLSFLKKHDVWDVISSMRCRSYDRLEAWEKDGFSVAFSAYELGLDSLGAFVENRIIQLALLRVLDEHCSDNVSVYFDQEASFHPEHKGVITLDSGLQIQAKLITACDGANSITRASAGIGKTAWDYKQSATLITVKCAEPFESCTWQQFTPFGPKAFLPMHDHYACLVWYADKEKTALLNSLDNEQLLKAVMAEFPSQLPKCEVLEKGSFPLRRMHANQYYKDNIVLLGDAAHTINPLAGQGVNLGFQDVVALIDAIRHSGLDENLSNTLYQYSKKRRKKNLLMMSAMDAVYTVFSNDIFAVKAFRNIGLKLSDHAGLIKKQALKYAVGIST